MRKQIIAGIPVEIVSGGPDYLIYRTSKGNVYVHRELLADPEFDHEAFVIEEMIEKGLKVATP